MARTVNVAACNFICRQAASFDEFASHVRTMLDDARGADIVTFPELFTVELFSVADGWEQSTLVDLPRLAGFAGEFRALFESEAKERGQFIAAGSTLVEHGDGVQNMTYVYGPSGLLHEHAKTHVFPPEFDWNTHEGDEMTVLDLGIAIVGVNNCYENEIPECSEALTEQGVELILAPSFTFTEHGFWRVRHCAAARCIENQVYAVHCSTGGRPAGPLPGGWAQSSILSPCDAGWPANGVLAEAAPNQEQVISATLDLDALHENRETGAAPTYRDRRRRADLYTTWRSENVRSAARS
jgi:predicted amidohydrolase